MSGVLSEDGLKAQQSRIMNAMRAAAQPSQQIPEMQDITQSLMAQSSGQGNYFDSMKKFGDERAKTRVNAEVGIYNQMKEEAARGDEQVKSLHNAITSVAGEDPKLYTDILQDLHNDPENIDSSNVNAKVMKYAAGRGIVPLCLQKERADISKTLRGAEDPASIREWKQFQAMSPDQQKQYIHMKRTGGEEALDVGLGKFGAKSYADEQAKIQEADTFLTNVDVARDALAKAKMTGPVFGRIGKAASDPDYVNWQGAKNGLTLLAKSIYAMPSANFSDSDREFLDQITGGKFPTKDAAEKTIDRLELIAQKGIRNSKKAQQDVLTRKTYNRDAAPETPSTKKRLKYNPTTGNFE